MASVVSIKDVVRSSMTVPKFDKHLKIYRPKCGNNNKDVDNSPKTLNKLHTDYFSLCHFVSVVP